MKSRSRYTHFKSETHTWFKDYIIRKYINSEPNSVKTNEILRKYVNSYYRNYEENVIQCLLEIKTTTNCVGYIRINSRSNSHYSFCIPKRLMLSKVNQERFNFSRII